MPCASARPILSGDVPSWSERKAVEGAAHGTPGVEKVEYQLRIQP
jgi:osmotically-inducible protein OsmY